MVLGAQVTSTDASNGPCNLDHTPEAFRARIAAKVRVRRWNLPLMHGHFGRPHLPSIQPLLLK